MMQAVARAVTAERVARIGATVVAAGAQRARGPALLLRSAGVAPGELFRREVERIVLDVQHDRRQRRRRRIGRSLVIGALGAAVVGGSVRKRSADGA
jgi:hypothetical protein